MGSKMCNSNKLNCQSELIQNINRDLLIKDIDINLHKLYDHIVKQNKKYSNNIINISITETNPRESDPQGELGQPSQFSIYLLMNITNNTNITDEDLTKIYKCYNYLQNLKNEILRYQAKFKDNFDYFFLSIYYFNLKESNRKFMNFKNALNMRTNKKEIIKHNNNTVMLIFVWETDLFFNETFTMFEQNISSWKKQKIRVVILSKFDKLNKEDIFIKLTEEKYIHLLDYIQIYKVNEEYDSSSQSNDNFMYSCYYGIKKDDNQFIIVNKLGIVETYKLNKFQYQKLDFEELLQKVQNAVTNKEDIGSNYLLLDNTNLNLNKKNENDNFDLALENLSKLVKFINNSCRTSYFNYYDEIDYIVNNKQVLSKQQNTRRIIIKYIARKEQEKIIIENLNNNVLSLIPNERITIEK